MVASKRRGRRTGKVTFLAHLEGIKKMLDAGHTMISVFEEYENKLSIKPGQFGKYVRKFIRSKPDGNEGKKAEAPAHSPSIEIGTKESVVRKAAPSERKFVRKENRDDLVHPKPKE